MIRNLTFGCAVILVVTFSLFSFVSQAPRADLTYVNPSGIHTLDPARMSWTQDFRVAFNIWEGLTTLDPRTTEPIEGAALFPPVVSEDGRSYTFTIHKDARWSNGDRVTAGDFVRGWRRAIEPGTSADYAFFLMDHVVGAEDYVAWRYRGVATLTALSRMRDGWSVDSETLDALRGTPLFDDIRRLGAGGAGDNAAHWSARYDVEFQKHADGFSAAFENVGIKALGDRTLLVRLIDPCPYFLELTAMPALLPCHESIESLRERRGDAPFNAQGLVVYDPQWTKPDYHRHGYPGLITNGPYRLTDWQFKRRARLSVNPHHRAADQIHCRTIDMLVFDNVSSAIMAYEAGRIDFLPAMDVSYDHEIARLISSGERTDFHLCRTFATYFLNFNCTGATVGDNPFTDARVRKAFALAIDKHAVVDRVLRRGDTVAHTFVPPGIVPGYRSPSGSASNPIEARRLLVESGFPAGDGLPTIEFLYVASDERIVQSIARMWETALGARVELICKESKAFAADKANQRYMVARANWFGDYRDPLTFLDCLTIGNGNNDSGYRSAAYDGLIEQAGKANGAERMALLARAEAIIVEQDFPIVPLFHYATPIAIQPYVTGLYPNSRLFFSFRYAAVRR